MDRSPCKNNECHLCWLDYGGWSPGTILVFLFVTAATTCKQCSDKAAGPSRLSFRLRHMTLCTRSNIPDPVRVHIIRQYYSDTKSNNNNVIDVIVFYPRTLPPAKKCHSYVGLTAVQARGPELGPQRQASGPFVGGKVEHKVQRLAQQPEDAGAHCWRRGLITDNAWQTPRSDACTQSIYMSPEISIRCT